MQQFKQPASRQRRLNPQTPDTSAVILPERQRTRPTMDLIHIIIYLVIIGVVLGLINRIPMADSIRSIINGIVVLFVVIWLLQVFGVLGPIGGYTIGSPLHRVR
jgi:hypothetical protein